MAKRQQKRQQREYDPKDKFTWQEGDIVITKKAPKKKTKEIILDLVNLLKRRD